MKKPNYRVVCYHYRYCSCYVYKWKVILTWEDWGYYLGGRLWWDIDLLRVEQADEMTARRLLRVVQALKFKKEEDEKIRYLYEKNNFENL